MAKTVIVYSTTNRILRRLVVGVSGGAGYAGSGESVLVLDQAAVDPNHPEIAFQSAMGFAPNSAVCAIVNGLGAATGLTLADPLLDAAPVGCALSQNQTLIANYISTQQAMARLLSPSRQPPAPIIGGGNIAVADG